MSFAKTIDSYRSFDIRAYCASVTGEMVDRVLSKQSINDLDFLALLSDAADARLEETARRAAQLPRRHFGNAVILFTPMYISNYCDNVCPYCSFSHQHDIVRSHLSLPDIEQEAARISAGGIRHILVLTGRSATSKTPCGCCAAIFHPLQSKFTLCLIRIMPAWSPRAPTCSPSTRKRTTNRGMRVSIRPGPRPTTGSVLTPRNGLAPPGCGRSPWERSMGFTNGASTPSSRIFMRRIFSDDFRPSR